VELLDREGLEEFFDLHGGGVLPAACGESSARTL
jgi:hypothetical protein